MIPRIWTAILATVAFFCCLQPAIAADDDTRWVTYQTNTETIYLRDDRRPALYTGNFGDCLGGSSINVTRFDAAYYKDNMTVLFHLAGNSGLMNQSLMMYIGVYAYGESRFDLTFNPCAANIDSLCPINSSVPIEASGIIPVNQEDVAGVPPIALTIPDFEGEAILRIFANETESEVGCYSAVITNGATFSHPEAVGSILGIFAFIAMVASFVTAAYGEAVPTMRLHYAHSLSVGVVFAVFQHIFYTGALSMNWPSVLVAWWSNFAWAGGMIYSSSMQNSIYNLIGTNVGNTSQVGAAQAGSTQESLGGGYDISQIYKRAFSSGTQYLGNHPLVRDIAGEIYRRSEGHIMKRDFVQRSLEHSLAKRELANASSGFEWYGQPVAPGLPLPGNYSGFAGTLAVEQIPASNAFMTGFLWFLICLVLLVAALMALKWSLEAFVMLKMVKQDRFAYFRQHWLGYSGLLALRICYIGWFMIMFLTMFQFTYDSSGGVKAVAAIVFVIFLIGIPGAAAYAIWYKKAGDRGQVKGSGMQVERKMLLGKIPWFALKKTEPATPAEQTANTNDQQEKVAADIEATDTKNNSAPFWKRTTSDGSIENELARGNVHDNEDYTTKFGWLASRFRRTRWWFFAAWIFYEFLRAIFFGGASGNPYAQVFGLVVIEVLAFAFITWARPFEGRRLNLLVVYCLGFSKVATVALSAAFITQYNLERITTTVIGIVIIVIQGILTILTMIAIVVGAISSWMSVSRNREDFRPRKWAGLREKYFNHLDRVVNDVPREPKPKPEPVEPEEPKYGFEFKGARRMAKIEDEDPAFASEMQQHPGASRMSFDQQTDALDRSETVTPARRSRAASVQSVSQTNLPFGARSHRPSWSTRDLTETNDQDFTPIDMSRHVPEDEPVEAPPAPANKKGIFRAPSRGKTAPEEQARPRTSTDSLSVGGDVSTRDTIGRVPAPSMRPRAGSLKSNRPRSNTPTYGSADGADSMSNLPLPPNVFGQHKPPLTPAQEQEEFALGLTHKHSANQ
ncbi:TRP-domain-containing protein [Hortaea werneckii]|nr:TRP-domain-containing protein [Hortaea werneckii]